MTEPSIDVATLSAPARKILDPAAPAPLRQMAARGLAPGLKPGESLTVLVVLASAEDAGLAATARASLAKLPAPLLNGALTGDLPPFVLAALAPLYAQNVPVIEKLIVHPAMPDDALALVAASASEAVAELIATNEQRLLGYPDIIEKLYLNKATRMSTADRLLELAVRNNVELKGIAAYKEAAAAIGSELIAEPSEEPTPDDVHFRETAEVAEQMVIDAAQEDTHRLDEETGEEVVDQKFLPLHARIAAMTISQKIRTAMLGNAAARLILVRDSNRLVAAAAIKSPSIQENEVVRIAASRNVSEDVLRTIAMDKVWTRSHQIKLNLVQNPRTPFAFASKLLPHLRETELKAVAKSKNVAGAVATAAKQHLQRRNVKACGGPGPARGAGAVGDEAGRRGTRYRARWKARQDDRREGRPALLAARSPAGVGVVSWGRRGLVPRVRPAHGARRRRLDGGLPARLRPVRSRVAVVRGEVRRADHPGDVERRPRLERRVKPRPAWPVLAAFLAVMIATSEAAAWLVHAVGDRRAGGDAARAKLEATRFALSAPGLSAVAASNAVVLTVTALATAWVPGARAPGAGDLRRELRLEPSRASALGLGAAIVAVASLSLTLGSLATATGLGGGLVSGAITRALRAASPADRAVTVVCLTAVPALGEELFFRGLMQPRLSSGWGRLAGIAGSAAAFGALHIDPVQGSMAFLVGLLLGWIAERFDGVRPGMLAHAANNAIFLALAIALPEGPDAPVEPLPPLAAAGLGATLAVAAVAVLRSAVAVRAVRAVGAVRASRRAA